MGANESIVSALNWLSENQRPSGEFPSYASPLTPQPSDWSPDTLKFITALAVLELATVDSPIAGGIIDKAVAFLLREREASDLWRYWSSDSDQFNYTPPDADDIACCSMAVSLRGHSTPGNIPLLLANRDKSGMFYTWFVPRAGNRSPRLFWALRGERRKATREIRSLLWENSEAFPDDVDGVVNANVLRYLGPTHAPAEVIGRTIEIVESGAEADCDSWHRNPFSMYRSVADGFRRGIRQFESLGPVIIDRIVERTASGREDLSDLDISLALLALQGFQGPESTRSRLAEWLVSSQKGDGSWARSVFYYGGPKEVFGWGSEALTTASAVGALAGEAK